MIKLCYYYFSVIVINCIHLFFGRNQEYVCKRKAYEDMCERHRFVFESTNILDEIDRFGESKVTILIFSVPLMSNY